MKLFWLAVKVLGSGVLLWLVFRSISLDSVAERVSNLSSGWAVLALLAAMLTFVPLAWRWQAVSWELLPGIGYPVMLRICTIGIFFNQILPSSLGGDGVRVWLLYRRGIALRDVLHSVLADRAAGMLTLLFLVALTLPVHGRLIADPTARLGLQLVAATGFSGFIALLLLSGRWARWLEDFRLTRMVRDLAVTLHQVFCRPKNAVVVFGASLLAQLDAILMMYLLAKGMGLSLPYWQLLVLVPPIQLLQLIPISIGGWGLREGLMVGVLGVIGIPADAAATLSVLFGLVSLLASLPGGLLLFWERVAPAEALANLEPMP